MSVWRRYREFLASLKAIAEQIFLGRKGRCRCIYRWLLKVDDGADRARQVAMAGILRRLGQGGSRLAALALARATP